MRTIALFLALALMITSCTPSTTTTEIVPTAAQMEPTVAPSVPTAGQMEATATQSVSASTEEVTMPFTLSSSAFPQGQPIPAQYSCKGRDISPPLEWGEELPNGTKSLALIMDDPDAPVGIWVHWVLYNIPTSAHGWPENTPKDPELVNGALQGTTSARSTGYHGPCPPSGTHRYFFKLYALDAKLSLPSGATKEQLLQAMEGHILAQAELMGIFSK